MKNVNMFRLKRLVHSRILISGRMVLAMAWIEFSPGYSVLDTKKALSTDEIRVKKEIILMEAPENIRRFLIEVTHD